MVKMFLGLSKEDFNWIFFYLILIICWFLVFIMGSYENQINIFSNIYGKEFFLALCRTPAGFKDFHVIFLMWIIMGAAMMVPTFIPVLVTYKDLTYSKENKMYGFWILILGFLIVWILFAFFITSIQLLLLTQNILSANGTFLSPFLSSLLLSFAGIYQFSSLKNNCLKKCRSPMLFFMQYWNDNLISVFIIGFKVGIFCLGCCWLLMSLGFVGGSMNYFFMGLSTLMMTFEKLPRIGNFFNKFISLALLLSALYIISKELTTIF